MIVVDYQQYGEKVSDFNVKDFVQNEIVDNDHDDDILPKDVSRIILKKCL